MNLKKGGGFFCIKLFLMPAFHSKIWNRLLTFRLGLLVTVFYLKWDRNGRVTLSTLTLALIRAMMQWWIQLVLSRLHKPVVATATPPLSYSHWNFILILKEIFCLSFKGEKNSLINLGLHQFSFVSNNTYKKQHLWSIIRMCHQDLETQKQEIRY